MKKLAFIFMAMVAMTFAACGGNGTSTDVANDSTAVDTVVADTILVDTVAVDSVTAE